MYNKINRHIDEFMRGCGDSTLEFECEKDADIDISSIPQLNKDMNFLLWNRDVCEEAVDDWNSVQNQKILYTLYGLDWNMRYR